jgi:hypothetical protein
MATAYSATQILQKRYKTLNWSQKFTDAFGVIEDTGIIEISGNSTNGKSALIMQLTKELAGLKMGKVFLNAVEEGVRLNMQKSIIRYGIEEVKQHVLIGSESIEDLEKRLAKQKSPRFVIIDSVQACKLTKPQFERIRSKYQFKKLFIFINQTSGNKPKTKVGEDVQYYADQKIWVEGWKAISKGRSNPGGVYTIWEEGSEQYWGKNDK